MSAYYNEIDRFSAAWLRELIKERLIVDGEVDERSIVEVQPSDLNGFTQCHFFTGIGGWSYALQLARWPDDRPVWTGSCPCQPYSVAGEGKGDEDERDLWPSFSRLITQSKPPVVFGEQVVDAIRWGWLDRAFVDLETAAYACGSAILPALAVGADHERKRIFFVADTYSERWERPFTVERISKCPAETFTVDVNSFTRARTAVAGHFNDLLPRDGLSLQVERYAIKGYGNAIVPQVAAEFIRAYMEVCQ